MDRHELVDSLLSGCGRAGDLLGFWSFDNIPLTKLALEQGGYDWGVLAYCAGFGGSMIWFGGWHVPIAYVIGFFVMLLLWGWRPA